MATTAATRPTGTTRPRIRSNPERRRRPPSGAASPRPPADRILAPIRARTSWPGTPCALSPATNLTLEAEKSGWNDPLGLFSWSDLLKSLYLVLSLVPGGAQHGQEVG